MFSSKGFGFPDGSSKIARNTFAAVYFIGSRLRSAKQNFGEVKSVKIGNHAACTLSV